MLENLSNSRVFEFFEELSKIPHGSGNTKKISDFCVKFAKERGLWVYQDDLNNVIIKKRASVGYENHEPVILQGHLDMVCEKDPDCNIDFENDGLELFIDGDLIGAKGTTLGGDDGIAVAMVLSVLDDNTLSHPPIEAVFTVDEETGMFGAAGLDTTKLSSKTLINIDSEDEGVFTVSCAGGARCQIKISSEREDELYPAYKINVSGLIGGHSGVEINRGRLNANALMANLISYLNGRFEIKFVSIDGGSKDNVITRECEAVITCSDSSENLQNAVSDFYKSVKTSNDPELKISVIPFNTARPMKENPRILTLLSSLLQGILKMSEDIENLPQTSLNLGVCSTKENEVKFTHSVRSSKNSERDELLSKLKDIALNVGADFSQSGVYPAWEYRKESRLRDVMVDVFKQMYKKKPIVEAIHAGLECGLFCDKIENLDAVSFGPNLYDIHTSRERMSISSVKRCYEMLLSILENL